MIAFFLDHEIDPARATWSAVGILLLLLAGGLYAARLRSGA